MRAAYCPQCGAPLVSRNLGDETDVPFCAGCGRPWFDGFSTCILAIAVSFDWKEVCLIRQSYGQTRRFVAVAGFMKPGETPEEAVRRELFEELRLTAADTPRYAGSWANPEKDELMLGFACRVGGPDRPRPALREVSSEVAEARWFSVEEADAALENARIARKLFRLIFPRLNC